MTEEINIANKIIEDNFSRMKTARSYLQLMDDAKTLNEQNTNKKFIEAITPLHIDTLCCVCNYNITTIYKHLLLSGNAPDSIFFIKELSATVYESLLAIEEYEPFMEEHFPTSIFEEYQIKKKELDLHKDTIRLIRNKSIYHISKDFRIYYDKMLTLFQIPIIEIWNNTIDLIRYIQLHNKTIMKLYMNKYLNSIIS